MRKVWIVVGNSSVAKIYRTENNSSSLIEFQNFLHKESHLPARELVSDRLGRETSRMGYGTDTMEPQTPIKVKEGNAFAAQVAEFLEKGFNAKEFERLYLIAKPPFLGYLRDAIHSNVAKLVESEIHKDLTQHTSEQIREYLPPVL